MKRILILSLALLATACGERASDVMQGYGEADYIYLSSQDAGIVGEVLVREGDTVEAGAQIFRLDPERLSYGAQSAEAQRAAAAAAVTTARAEAVLAERNYARGAQLAAQDFYPRARLDADRAARDAANARLAQARREASAMSAETGLARERLNDLAGAAPAAGTIEQIFHRPGEVVAAGQPIVALLPPENMKVRFFAPEELLSQLRLGARVNISCDGEGCAEPIAATISFIAREPQFTPPVIYSLDQREKLVYLVEARFTGAVPIRPGMPVDVRLAAND
ncbi:HlyD family secretion protein [Terricaulis silvestris]|uniref:Putative efflux pump membrane fusion protein n=1 Tax=Terricaulis silvestris TaxID=2686094 RepID=A0A6I6N0A7_9CAUL|nr:efflux RND transporter periplasmic adaptor subunit [Terricaulis silvestris]QGZ96763.1 putative efflux pump membrane fusion protein [Terricaulis silvestris]